MKWLLWKDYRHNRLIVFTALFFLLVPHLIALFGVCKLKLCDDPEASHWPEFFGVSSVYSLALCQAAVALIGGNAIAGERVDRSAEFLFSLPITRRKLLASKVLLAMAVAAVPWLMNGSILWCLAESLLRVGLRDLDRVLINTAITGIAFFCVAWLLSSLIASPTFAACGGLVTPLLFGSGFYLFVAGRFDGNPDNVDLDSWYRAFCLILSPLCFALGTWLYLRRVEP